MNKEERKIAREYAHSWKNSRDSSQKALHLHSAELVDNLLDEIDRLEEENNRVEGNKGFLIKEIDRLNKRIEKLGGFAKAGPDGSKLFVTCSICGNQFPLHGSGHYCGGPNPNDTFYTRTTTRTEYAEPEPKECPVCEGSGRKTVYSPSSPTSGSCGTTICHGCDGKGG